MNPTRYTRRTALASLGALLASGPALAQEPWPARPIRMVVPFPPGGSSDILGRLLAEQIGKALNANVVVENKPGGTTQIGTELVATAQPDGYTMLLGASIAFTQLPNLRKLNFSLDSFEVLGGVADYMGVMAVKKALNIRDLRQFVEHAKKNPGKLSFGSAGEASAGHIYGATLARDTGIQVLHVPFRGSADAANALVAGEIDFIIDGAIVPMAKAGRVDPLATFYSKRHPALPNVPTVAEAGFDIAMTRGAGWALLVPKGTPANIVGRLSNALQQVLAQPAVHEALVRANSLPAWQTGTEYRAAIAADRKMYADLLPAIGVRGS